MTTLTIYFSEQPDRPPFITQDVPEENFLTALTDHVEQKHFIYMISRPGETHPLLGPLHEILPYADLPIPASSEHLITTLKERTRKYLSCK